MSEKIMDIIILNWNRKNYTEKTIENVIARTTIPHSLILVDNNSTEESGVRQYLDTVKGNKHTVEVKHVRNSVNYGVGGGRNTGLMVASGDYLVTLDDDVLIPKDWDVLMAQACDKIPKLGITGINVEPFKFPVRMINGVRMRPKAGNLGGACLCLPSRVFKRVGFYMSENIYGHEDAEMRCRLDLCKLVSAYVEPRGIHLDDDKMKNYRVAKNKAHVKGSLQLAAMSQFRRKLQIQLKETGSLYVPFNPENFKPVDGNIFINDLVKK